MSARIEYLTFDCYGTLVDWECGIVAAFSAAGADLPRHELLDAHAEIEPIVQSGAYRSYRNVLRETSERIAQRFQWTIPEGAGDFLPRSVSDWPPFPDTRAALERLQAAGIKMAILSNVDVDLLTATLRRIGIEFDMLVTAQDVGSYKPNHGHFLAARKQIADARWLHVAGSYFHDVAPCLELDVPVAWINRKREELVVGAEPPTREFYDLTELADWLTG